MQSAQDRTQPQNSEPPTSGMSYASDFVPDLINSLRDIFYVIASNETFAWLSLAFETVTGWRREEWQHRPFSELLHPDDLERAHQSFRRTIQGEVPPPSEFRIRRNDGDYVTVELMARPLEIQGLVIGTFGTARDVTDRIRAEAALRESEERFRAQSKSSPVPIYTWQREGSDFELIDYNDAAEAATRENARNLLSKKASDLYADEPGILEDFAHCLEMRGNVTREMAYRLRSTSENREMDVTYVFVPPDLVMVHAQDITERKRTAEALRESEERYRRLVEEINEVIFELDADVSIRYVSPVVEQLTGYTPAELVGRHAAQFIHPEDLPGVMESIKANLKEDLHPSEYRVLTKSGDYAWVRSFSRLIYSNGKIAGLRGVQTDITALRESEEALLRAREELEGKVERQLLRRNPYGLTFRELTVLNLVAVGRSDKEIGAELAISPLTAQKHISNIMAKMDASSRTEVASRALREGLLD